MSKISYARQVGQVYEFGHIEITNSGTKFEKRTHVPQGICPTLDQALQMNQMALRGAPRIGRAISPAFTWSDAPMALFTTPSLRAGNDVEMAA